jgi:glutaredoxin 3
MITEVSNMSKTPKVEIYTGMACGYCMRVLRLFDAKQIKYKQIDVSMSSALRAEMTRRAGGRKTVPQVFLDGEHIGDCDELFCLENAGHLDKLLALS